MTWTINYSEIAAKQMQKLDKSISNQIDRYLTERIAKSRNPKVYGKALVNDKAGIWRYRIGDYRILCELKEKELVVLVLQIGHRRLIYKRRR